MGWLSGFVFVAACLHILDQVGYKFSLFNMLVATIVIVPVGVCARLIFEIVFGLI